MSPIRRPRPIAWIAAFAVMLAALAPTLTHALSWVSGAQVKWTEVCTVAGVKLVAVSDDGGDPAGSSDGGLNGLQVDHCPYCHPHAGSFALPPADVPALRVPAGGEPLPPLFLNASRPLFAWASIQPRAPPHAA
ncbi:DUF2946 domain-containing protein [Pseudothauera rhizosphaerae]|uniref:DUF2946 domain-containing protein n=1 Tax=Pseudothauera rhizosphaerae TaxID=2565932 RepID=A0A4S4AML8_9RHOO|nr:DUF2946 domain-containing protein [Pseudothauera rhizosphaerae]THF60841.1 DUF2946 domain-containing protein [Pseudothauera rhizosphaerae]